MQTTPWHREEEPLKHHETPGRQNKYTAFPELSSLKNLIHVFLFILMMLCYAHMLIMDLVDWLIDCFVCWLVE